MLAKGTSPIIVAPILLFILCFLSYVFFLHHWAFIVLAILFTFLSCMGMWFFRDPYRKIAPGLVSSADGIVSFVKRSKDGKSITVSVFMNVHNVHVNRAPWAGKVTKSKHYAGGHMPAYEHNADKNEHVVTEMITDLGPIRIVQIAGTVARRIIPYIKKGDRLEKGERIGIIRLGSRVDVTLPATTVKVKVTKGQKVLAGETTLALVKGASDDKEA
jgi:phosphatidylserine decarboxylase